MVRSLPGKQMPVTPVSSPDGTEITGVRTNQAGSITQQCAGLYRDVWRNRESCSVVYFASFTPTSFLASSFDTAKPHHVETSTPDSSTELRLTIHCTADGLPPVTVFLNAALGRWRVISGVGG